MTRDLDALLADEIQRRVSLLHDDAALTDARQVLHALRGSAGIAGYVELSLVLAHLGARLRAEQTEAIPVAREVLETAATRLRAGSPPLAFSWPRPPLGLSAHRLDAAKEPEYRAAIRDHLAALGKVNTDQDDRAALREAYRVVHSIKGAAAAAGDDLLAWYCHGLEASLKDVPDARLTEALSALGRHRGALALVFEDPGQALSTLRAEPSAPPPRRPSSAAPLSSMSADDPSLHIASHAVDRWLERLEQLYGLEETLGTLSESARESAEVLRKERASLHEALRQIGPPRPWGAPASAIDRIGHVARTLAGLADDAERARGVLRYNSNAIGRRYGELREELSHLRRTSVSELLTRVARATERLIAREALLVRVDINVTDAPLDRGIAERLFDPLLQLTRNAVAHGIEPPAERASRGKPPVGRVLLAAEPNANWMRITVQDDGRGVDLLALRRVAQQRGLGHDATSDEDLVNLLAEPGLSLATRESDLAGRGIGLDVVRGTLQSLGGSLHLSSTPGSGLVVSMEVPSDRAMIDILWLSSGSVEAALPLRFVEGVSGTGQKDGRRSLAGCLGAASDGQPPLGVRLSQVLGDARPLGVDAVGQAESTRLFALPRALARVGPYSGSVLRRDGRLGLVLDAHALAARLRPEN
ncbi:MAG: Hpt domain-containing protein [Polyangiaceae bacterium]